MILMTQKASVTAGTLFSIAACCIASALIERIPGLSLTASCRGRWIGRTLERSRLVAGGSKIGNCQSGALLGGGNQSCQKLIQRPLPTPGSRGLSFQGYRNALYSLIVSQTTGYVTTRDGRHHRWKSVTNPVSQTVIHKGACSMISDILPY